MQMANAWYGVRFWGWNQVLEAAARSAGNDMILRCLRSSLPFGRRAPESLQGFAPAGATLKKPKSRHKAPRTSRPFNRAALSLERPHFDQRAHVGLAQIVLAHELRNAEQRSEPAADRNINRRRREIFLGATLDI